MPRWSPNKQTRTPSGSWRLNSRSGSTRGNGSRMHPPSQSNGMSRTSSRKPSTPTASTSAKLWMLMVSGVASKPPLPSQLPPLSSTWMMTETRCRFERRETRSSVGLQGFPMAGLPRIRAAPSWERQASHTTSRGAYLEWKNGLVLVRSAGRREACTLERASASWSVFSDCMILLYFWVFCGGKSRRRWSPKCEQGGTKWLRRRPMS